MNNPENTKENLRTFYSREKIIDHVTNSVNFNKHLNEAEETLDNAVAILLFESSKQKSWMVGTNFRIYKILDDRRQDTPQINWSKKIVALMNKETKKLVYKLGDYKDSLSKVKFPHRDKEYLVSKRFFVNSPFEDAMERLAGNYKAE